MFAFQKNPPEILSWWQKPHIKPFVRLITLLVTLTFIFPYMTWALNGTAYAAQPYQIKLQSKLVEIPTNFGQTKFAFQGSDQLVVLVEDLHCNYEVQQNIAGLRYGGWPICS